MTMIVSPWCRSACRAAAAATMLAAASPTPAAAEAPAPLLERAATAPMPLATALERALDPSRPLDSAVLEALRGAMAGMEVAMPPQVTRDGDSRLVMHLAAVTMEGAEGEPIEIPTLAIVAERRSADETAFVFDMARELRTPDAVIRMDKPEMTALYDSDLAAFTSSRAVVTNIVSTPTTARRAGGTLAVEAVSLIQSLDERATGLYGRGELTVSGIRMAEAGGGGLHIGRIAGSYDLNGMDAGGYRGLTDLLALVESGGDAAVPEAAVFDALAALRWQGIDGTTHVADLRLLGDGGEEMARMDGLTLSLSSANADGSGPLRLGLKARDAAITEAGWADIAANDPTAPLPPPALVPRDLSLTATLENLPIAAILRAARAADPEAVEAAVASAITEAGTRLVLTDFALAAPAAAITGELTVAPSRLVPEMVEAEGAFVLTGLERALAAVRDMPAESDGQTMLAALIMLKGMGEPAPGGDGGLIYRVAFGPDTGLTVNGLPLDTLLMPQE